MKTIAEKKDRIKWVDCARFIGIFTIYLGHFASHAGKAYTFVFYFHVALFFFISGCMSNYDNEKNFFKYVWKKFKKIMIPFFVFSVISIIIQSIQYDLGLNQIISLLKVVMKGNIRNTFIADSLWFLSCLFTMEVIFKLLKYLKSRISIFIMCFVMFVIASKFISPIPIISPHFLYNIDSALYYIIFFALGYVLYPYIISLFQLDSLLKKIIFISSGIISFLYAISLFFGKNYITILFSKLPSKEFYFPIIIPMIIIWTVLLLSKIIENVDYFRKIGSETLYLCGNEFVIKSLFSIFIELFSLKVSLNTPLHSYVYSFILIAVCMKLIIPKEKDIAMLIKNQLKTFVDKR